MPDSSFAITAGSGTSIDTRTEATNSEHRQVIVVGDPSANAGVTAVLNAAPAATDYGVAVRPVGQLADDAAFTVATTPVLPIGALVDETLPDSADEGDIGAPRMTADRKLLVRVVGATDANRLDIDGSGRATVVGAGTAGTPAGGVVSVQGVASGTTLPVTAAQTTASSLNAQIVGELAHDAIDSGNPIKIGGIADTDLQPAVADGDRTQAWFDRHGRIHTRSGHQSAAGNVLTAIHVPAANTTATASIAAGGVGIRNVCTGLTVVIAATATAPTAVNVTANLIDGATGGTTYLWRSTLSLPATAGETRGITRSGLWLPGTANTALTLEYSAAGGANTIESVSLEGVRITE